MLSKIEKIFPSGREKKPATAILSFSLGWHYLTATI
jgi:hypothetical protein